MVMKKYLLFFCLILTVIGACQPAVKEKSEETVDTSKLTLFIGTYTLKEGHVDGQGEGVYVYEMDKATGELSYLATSESVISPSYLAVHPNGKWVFAVNEFNGGEEEFASLSVLEYKEADHSLSYLTSANALGQYPCYVSLDNSGNFAMIANYVGGSVAAYAIDNEGLIEEASSYKQHEGSTTHPRQEAAHAHMIVQHPKYGWVFAVDLGADKVFEYKLDTLSMTLDFVADYPVSEPMSGPRHLAFHPERDFAYLLNELNGTVEVRQLSEADHFGTVIQTVSTMAEGDERAPASAAIKVHPSGKFLYASNRGEVNEIVAYAIAEDGTLSPVGWKSTQGLVPRDFEIDPTGTFLLAANQDSNSIVTFRINQETGALEETGLVAEVSTPVCIKFRP